MMNLVYTSATMAVAMTVWRPVAAAAQEGAPASKRGSGETAITLARCIQSEAEYRRATGSGTGGVGGFGVGLSNEFVLINAARNGTSPAAAAPQGSTLHLQEIEITSVRELSR